VPPVPRDLAPRLPRLVPRHMAVPELAPARLLGGFARPRRPPVHPRRVHEDLAPDGTPRGHGLVRHIGTSNMTVPSSDCCLGDARIGPAVNEMELASALPAAGVVRVRPLARHRARRLLPAGIAQPAAARPDGDDTVDMEDPVILEIAGRHGVPSVRGLSQVGGAARTGADSRCPPRRSTMWPTCRRSSAIG